MIYSFAHIYNR